MANLVKVQNHEARVTTIGYSYGKVAGGHGMGTHKLRLKPGVNEVDDDAWNQAKQLPAIQAMLKSRDLEELVLKRPGLKGYTVDGAIEVVEGTFDRELLRKWKGEETREPVISAIETQIVKTAPQPGDADATAQGGSDSPGNIGDLPAPEARSAAVGFSAQEIAEQLQNGQAEPTTEEIAAAAARAEENAKAAQAKAAASKPAPASTKKK